MDSLHSFLLGIDYHGCLIYICCLLYILVLGYIDFPAVAKVTYIVLFWIMGPVYIWMPAPI